MPPMDPVSLHAQTANQFSSLTKAETNAKEIQRELSSLSRLGDTVTFEDILDSATRLVERGVLSADSTAQLLAAVPTQPEAMSAWVAQQTQAVGANLAKLSAIMPNARHQTGLAALQMLQAHQMGGRAPGPQPQPQAPPMSPQQLALAPPAGNA